MIIWYKSYLHPQNRSKQSVHSQKNLRDLFTIHSGMGIHPSRIPWCFPASKGRVFLNAVFAIRKACNSWRVLYPRRFWEVDRWNFSDWFESFWVVDWVWDLRWMNGSCNLCVFQPNASYCRWLAWIHLNMCLDFTTWSSLKGQPIGHMFTGTRDTGEGLVPICLDEFGWFLQSKMWATHLWVWSLVRFRTCLLGMCQNQEDLNR